MSVYPPDGYVGVRAHEKFSVTSSGILVSAANQVQRVVEFYNEGVATVYLYGANDAAAAVDKGRILAAEGVFSDAASDEAWWAFTSSGTATLRTITVAARPANRGATPNL